MRVTHSLWRRSSPGSRIRWSTPSRAYRSRISVVASSDAVVGRDDEVDARVEVVRDLRVDDVGLVARRGGS